MHFKMGFFSEYQTAEPAYRQAKQSRTHQAPQHQRAKSFPIDAEDLRRRLNLVIAERDSVTGGVQSTRSVSTFAEVIEEDSNDEEEGNAASQDEIIKRNQAAREMLAAWAAESKTTNSDQAARDMLAVWAAESKTTSSDQPAREMLAAWATESKAISSDQAARDMLAAWAAESKSSTEPTKPRKAALDQDASGPEADKIRDAKLIHKLSLQALKFHTKRTSWGRSAQGHNNNPPADLDNRLQRALSHPESFSERSQAHDHDTDEPPRGRRLARDNRHRHTILVDPTLDDKTRAAMAKYYDTENQQDLASEGNVRESTSERHNASYNEARERKGVVDVRDARKVDPKWKLKSKFGTKPKDRFHIDTGNTDEAQMSSQQKSPVIGFFSKLRR